MNAFVLLRETITKKYGPDSLKQMGEALDRRPDLRIALRELGDIEVSKPDKGADLKAALEKGFADAVGRMVRRIGVHAEREAKKPKTFLAWLDSIKGDHLEAVTQVLSGPVSALAVLGGGECPGEAVAYRLLSLTREKYLVASECQASELLAFVQDATLRLQGETVAVLMEEFFHERP